MAVTNGIAESLKESGDSSKTRLGTTPILAGTTALSMLTVLVAGVLGSGATGLWRDEGLTLAISRRTIEGVLGVILNREANMGLYYVLLHGWIQVGGEGVVWIRGLSLVSAVLTIPALVWVATQLSGPKTGILTALLAPGSAVLLRNAVEARSYSLANLLAVLTVGLLVYALRRGSRSALAVAVVSATAMIYSQILAVLLLGGLALGVATFPARKLGVRELGVALLGLLGLISPILWFSVARDRGQTSWIPALGVRSVREFAATFGGTLPAVTVLMVVVVAAVVAAVRANPRHAPLVFVLSWLMVPPTLLLLLSVIKPLFVPRYVATSAPALVLVTALIVLGLAARWRGIVVAALIVVTASGSMYTLFMPRSDDVSAAAEFINSNSQRSDAVIYDPATARGSMGFLIGGRVQDVALLPNGSPVDQRDVWGLEMSAPDLAERLRREKRVWLVHYPGSTWAQTPEPAREVRGQALPAVPQMRREFGELVVELYQR